MPAADLSTPPLKDVANLAEDGSLPVRNDSRSMNPQLHVVIAHFSEEPFWMKKWIDNVRQVPHAQKLGVHVVIYTKSPEADLEHLKSVTGVEEVVRLPNVGREGGTYLHHISRYYDQLPDLIWFSQSILKKAQRVDKEHTAELEDWLVQRLHTQLDAGIGFMSLDRKHDICHCGHCTDMGRDDYYPLLPQLHALLTGRICQAREPQVISFNGHFIVSRQRILARRRSTYEYLQELVDAPDDHPIHAETEPEWFDKDKGQSKSSNPKFGHTLERSWHTVFNCSDPAMVVDCDLKGMRAEGPGGCSCRDAA